MPLATMAQNDTLGHERNITLSEAIVLARTQSVDAAVALNELKTAYWEYRTFRADLLPEVNFTGTLPNYNKSYSTYQNSDCHGSPDITKLRNKQEYDPGNSCCLLHHDMSCQQKGTKFCVFAENQ